VKRAPTSKIFCNHMIWGIEKTGWNEHK